MLKLWHVIALFSIFNCAGLNQQTISDVVPKSFEVWKKIKHVVIVVLENGSPVASVKQSFMHGLMKKGAYFENFYAITHPSQPNYIAMIAGSTLGVKTNKNYDLNEQHIGDILEKAEKTWRVYVEGYPGNCFLDAKLGTYVRKHVPFLSFKNVQRQPNRCKNIVSAKEFDVDVASDRLPTYSLYVPDLLNDGHDTSVDYADSWLRKAFGPHFNNEKVMKDTLFIITFDEDDRFHSNRIYTVFLGAGVKPGFISKRRYDHYSTLKTIEDIFQLDDLGKKDSFAKPIIDIWQN